MFWSYIGIAVRVLSIILLLWQLRRIEKKIDKVLGKT